MTTSIPKYDTLYVVSDIHMGGSQPRFQILNQGPRLGKLIQQLARGRPDDEVALVLNGDVIDSLAEDSAGYIATDTADHIMRHLYRDPAFEPVWRGLAEFVGQDHRHLIFVLGNHDLEVMLPHVEYSIRRELTQGDMLRQGRITFATHGGGYACKVGPSSVFCTHGNEVDDWNVVDYDALGRLARSINAGWSLKPSEWTPNAGTRFVIDVMNDIKRDYPFVDLLKPATETVVPILLVLEPSRIKDVLPFLPGIVARRFWGGLKKRGILSGDIESMEAVTDRRAAGDAAIESLLGPHLQQAIQSTGSFGPRDTDALLLDVERSLVLGADSEGMETEETLGVPQYIADRLRGIDKVEALRQALQDWLSGDETFRLDTQDKTYKRVTDKTGPTVDFVITGHTHLERAIADNSKRLFYYNCGTWVRLLQLTPEILSNPETFQRVWDVLRAGEMEILDATKVKANDGSEVPLVLLKSTVVRISCEKGTVRGALLHVNGTGAGEVDLDPLPNSIFEKR